MPSRFFVSILLVSFLLLLITCSQPFLNQPFLKISNPSVATPTFSPAAGMYTTDQLVTLSCTTENSTIYYTLDGSEPTTDSMRYTDAITASVSANTTIKAIASASGYSPSVVGSAKYSNIYSIGDLGPAGGLVFYDKGSISDGWRYLEAAPSDQSTRIQWWYNRYWTTGVTATGIGSGKANTATIVSCLDIGSNAALLCAELECGGYNDWFLPSKDELALMYGNLKAAGIGSFSSPWWGAMYWSSSEISVFDAWVQDFDDGEQFYSDKHNNTMLVRAVRAFE